ncbi:cytochrome P450 [Halobacteriales archaeon QS_1_68_20]|nr:MAG: cytochrome P450 [Halobacteriales archaeon QS_1_68_20]
MASEVTEQYEGAPSGISTRERQLNPHPWFAEMREEHPVRWDPERETWDVFTYDAVTDVLRNHEVFSSETEIESDAVDTAAREFLQGILFNVDPPEHTRQRELLQDFFRRDNIWELQPEGEAIADDLLDDVEDDGHMDLVEDFSQPMTNRMIATMLGIPREDHDKFDEWGHVIYQVVNGQENLKQPTAKIGQEMVTYMTDLIAERREDPGDGLVSMLANAEMDGEPVGDMQIIQFCMLMMVGGTTTAITSNVVRSLAEKPHLFDELADDPGRLQDAIEEGARYETTSAGVSRVATQDFEFRGHQIEEGDFVVPWLMSANRDAEVFEDPHEFKPDRKPNPHLAFGYGIHACLGNSLGRLETFVALKRLLQRFEFVEVHDDDLTPVGNPFRHNVRELPITFEVAE